MSAHVFDELAEQWEANPGHWERTRAIANAMRQRVPLYRTMRACEVGCGTGLLGFELHAELGALTMTDPSAGMLEVLRGKIAAAGLTTMHADQRDLLVDPLPDASFELVMLQLALHHIPDLDGILERFHAMLAPGGWLAVADLDAEDGSFHGHAAAPHHAHGAGSGHAHGAGSGHGHGEGSGHAHGAGSGHGEVPHHGFDRAALQARVQAAGLEPVAVETVYQLVREVDGAPRSFPVFLLTARKPG